MACYADIVPAARRASQEAQMRSPSHEAPPFFDAAASGDATDVERIFAHCRSVVAESRVRRAASYVLHARHASAADAVVRLCRRLRRPPPRFSRPLRLSGGGGALAGARIVFVTDDPDSRDLMGLALQWCGAEFATIRLTDAAGNMIQWFRPHLVLVDLPFERDGAFDFAARVRALPTSNGLIHLVALTVHHHDHPEHEALRAGFEVQLPKPIEVEALEGTLARVLRRTA
jgi:CheY-like chemotaxis protein